ERRHWTNNELRPSAAIALLLELDRPECDQSEQHVVIVAVDPDGVGKRGRHPAAPAAAMTAAAVERHIKLVSLFDGAVGEAVGIPELALRRASERLQGRQRVLRRQVAECAENSHGETYPECRRRIA